MASLLAKYISKRVLGETLENNFGKDDPYFETVPASRLDGTPHPTKTKKVRKANPPGISEHDAKVLTKVKRRAYRLDMSLFSCFGVRFGWSSVIGIVPGIGDVLDAFMALMVLRSCQKVEGGLPNDVKSKMFFNIIVDFGIGLVPFLGDIADALFRANTKNAVVLEDYLRKKGAKNLKAQGRPIPAIDPTDPDEYDRQEAERSGPPPRYTTEPSSRSGTQRQQDVHGSSHRDPVPQESRGGGGWFSGFGSKNKQHDVERAERSDRPEATRVTDDTPRRQKSTLQKTRR
ncbi:PH domain-containing protein [Phlyctema vagabunda]|uniref:PH domain-containing protein n=1 Tax=Phlyctema vagabunda TaxID=108571 RepID=A0ABR4PJ49_9HELO